MKSKKEGGAKRGREEREKQEERAKKGWKEKCD